MTSCTVHSLILEKIPSDFRKTNFRLTPSFSCLSYFSLTFQISLEHSEEERDTFHFTPVPRILLSPCVSKKIPRKVIGYILPFFLFLCFRTNVERPEKKEPASTCYCGRMCRIYRIICMSSSRYDQNANATATPNPDVGGRSGQVKFR